ncbi:hypothetical protein KIN20_006892 [Parelaphostrongylus tenuis]|uniref:Peptidase C1A papain C-terminal domain-containing protein n=1 Tax=Parelaphostrongylus tenuis TaxID=148309 RepID=A0AAD5MKR5_PARTN|nr:hypothetical protein KIN20_006892 [Parelaphostrongylus tenuis]
MTPPYRVSSREEDIMTEIITNGPVQATFVVHEDFFMYAGGVYRHTELAARKGDSFTGQGYHAVRILGWGVDRTTGREFRTGWRQIHGDGNGVRTVCFVLSEEKIIVKSRALLLVHGVKVRNEGDASKCVKCVDDFVNCRAYH